MSKKYTTDLRDPEWLLVKNLISWHRRPKWDFRCLLNGIFYLVKNGCAWRDLPDSFPPWQTVYWYFIKWSQSGVMDLIMVELGMKIRQKAGRNDLPSAGVIDGQSVKNTAQATQEVGFDAGKCIKGRKRMFLVDTMGNLLSASVASAQESEAELGKLLIDSELPQNDLLKHMRLIYGDRAYAKIFKEHLKTKHKIEVQVPKTFTMLSKDGRTWISPKRWVVERTIGWLSTRRRLSKDYERKTSVSRAMIVIAWISIAIRKAA